MDTRAAMQDWKSFPVFLQEKHWQTLQSDEVRQLKKVETLSRYLVDLGLRHPSERTMTTLAALVSHLGGQHSDEDVPKLQALLATVKSVLKTHVTRAKQVGLPGFSNYLVTLPSTVAELPGPMITHFFPTGAFTPPVDLNPIWASAALWLCRSTNRQVNLVRQLTGGGGQLTDGVSSVAAVAQQAALQTVAAFAAMSSGVGQGVALPGIEILPAGHQAIARAKQQARPSPLVALMDRVEAQGTEQGAASTQGGTVESQAPVMVASPQATQPTNSGASAALPATVPQVQAESSVPTAPVLAVVSPVTEAQCEVCVVWLLSITVQIWNQCQTSSQLKMNHRRSAQLPTRIWRRSAEGLPRPVLWQSHSLARRVLRRSLQLLQRLFVGSRQLVQRLCSRSQLHVARLPGR